MDAEVESRSLAQDKQPEPTVAAQTIRKLDRTVLLLCTGVVFFAYTDRSNIGYAAKDLCNDIDLTHTEYGLGVSLFYAGYVTTQVGGNVVLARIGAPAWLSLIMFSWGVIETCMGFLQNKAQFYILRVLLGVAEGGTFPAIWYLLSLFYPAQHLTSAYSGTIAAVAFSMPLSSPISAGFIALGSELGIEGWRLLFIAEGVMPIVFSVVLYLLLPRDPQSMTSLEPSERNWILNELEKTPESSTLDLIKEVQLVLSNLTWWAATLCYLLAFGIATVVMFWATLIVHDMRHGKDDDEDSGTCGSEDGNAAISVLLTGIPYLFTGFACLWVKRHVIKDRAKFCGWVKTLGGLILASWALTRRVGFFFGFVSLTLSIGSGYITSGPIAALAVGSLDGSARSTASALLCTISSAGALIFPPIIGVILDSYGYDAAIPVCGAVLVAAGALAFSMKDPLLQSNDDSVDDLTPL